MNNTKPRLLERRRIILSADAFAEIVVWQLEAPLAGSEHPFKYRLAFVVRDACVIRFDNEAGKGDHIHVGTQEQPYVFISPRQLLADFMNTIARWRDEHGET